MSEMMIHAYTGRLWEDEDGIVYLNTHDSGPSLAMGANAFELSDMTIGLVGKRVQITVEVLEEETPDGE